MKCSNFGVLAILCIGLLFNSLSISGCANTPTRTEIPKSIGELPPVDHMLLARRRREIRIERGDMLEITYAAAKDRSEEIGPVTFLGVDPETSMLGLLSVSGQMLAIESSVITSITRIIENSPASAILWPTLSTAGGAGLGALIGLPLGGFAVYGGFSVGIISLGITGIVIGIARAGIDRDYETEDGKWRIVMPPVEPKADIPPKPEPETSSATAAETKPDAKADAGSGVDQ
ncbi:MAG: hypothetical protein GY847_09175 [Proteobacteria bacterium]|nr:hypothetical protein [Pseudomonadota bacterium]